MREAFDVPFGEVWGDVFYAPDWIYVCAFAAEEFGQRLHLRRSGLHILQLGTEISILEHGYHTLPSPSLCSGSGGAGRTNASAATQDYFAKYFSSRMRLWWSSWPAVRYAMARTLTSALLAIPRRVQADSSRLR